MERDGIQVLRNNELVQKTMTVSKFNTRNCFDKLMHFMTNEWSALTVLFGVRRTGKTVLMLQTINKLLELGVSSEKIAYVNLTRNKVRERDLYNTMCDLVDDGVVYLFVDEITYCDEDLNFLTTFTDVYAGKKIVVAGTDSLGFIPVLNGALYDRATVIHTTYVTFSEFNTLYPKTTVDDYLEAGGLLLSSRGYEESHNYQVEDFAKFGIDYLSTSVIDNVFHCFGRFDLSNRYPELSELYYSDRNKLRTLLFKWVQHYAKPLTLRIMNRALKSDDVGNLKDILRKRVIHGDVDLFCDELLHLFLEQVEIMDYTEYTVSQRLELIQLLKDLECIVEIPDTDTSLVLPLAIRIGCTCEVIRQLGDKYRQLSNQYNISLTFNELKEILLNNVKGELLEELIYLELNKIRGLYFNKYRDMDSGLEIDLVIGHDLYEIKHSSQQSAMQCRWLVHSETQQKLKPSSFNIIYTGETVMIQRSSYEIYDEIIAEMRERNLPISEDILCQREIASKKTITINYINASEFLLDVDRSSVKYITKTITKVLNAF